MPITDIRSPNLSRNRQTIQRTVHSAHGIVVAQNRHAAYTGAQVLAEGGNAIDAAIATSFALGVLEPWMSGPGGVGAMLVRTPDGAVTTIDGGAVAPATLDPADFPLVAGSDADLFGWPAVLEQRNVMGARAICVPGLVAALGHAHARFGQLPWARLVAPAVTLARQGPVVDYHTTLWIASEMPRLLRNAACRQWLLPGGVPPATPPAASGKVCRLAVPPGLPDTLQTIAAEGANALYEGPLARALVADVQAAGGYLSAKDLASYAVRTGAADRTAYRHHELHTVPGLNGGVTVAQAMAYCGAHYHPSGAQPDADTYLAYCEAMQHAWTHRFSELGDGADRAHPSCTSHLSVIDRNGCAVSLTQTLLSAFGSGVVSPQTGLLLNNGINWFDPRPGHVNSIGPGRKALANYSPTLMTGPDDDVIALGGSGGRKIIPATFQALAHIADFGFSLGQAIDAPRLDTSAMPTVVADARLAPHILEALAQRHPLVLAERIEHLCHFTILSAVRRQNALNQGHAEAHHSWADAVAQDHALLN